MSDNPVKLYGVEFAASVFPVLILMKENSITEDEIKLQITNPLEGQTKTDEFRTKNPMHTVAYLEDGPVKIWECRAILRYISSKYSLDKWYPTKDARQFALVETALGFSTVLYSKILPTFAQPEKKWVDHNQAEKDKVIKDWKDNGSYAFADLLKLAKEADPNQKGGFLGGEKPNIADLAFLGVLLPVYYNTNARAAFFTKGDLKDLTDYIARLEGVLGQGSKDLMAQKIETFWKSSA